MTTHQLIAKRDFASTATRPAGGAAAGRVIAELGASNHVTIDFAEVILTPSFTDEFVKTLLAHLQVTDFLQRIHFANLPSSAVALTKHITGLRTEGKSAPTIHHR